MPNPRGYVTLKQAAAYLGASPNTLRNWDRQGKLTAARHPVNRYRLYKLEDLAKLLHALSPSTKPAVAESAVGYTASPLVQKSTQTPRGTDRRFLRRVFSQLAKAFRDSGGGGAPIERFEEISKLLFAKMFAELESGEKEWMRAASLSDSAAHKYVYELYQRAPDKYPEVFRGRYAEISKDTRAVAQCARILADVRLRNVAEDFKGAAYEELVRGTFDKEDHQQFFTPRVVVDFMVEMTRPKPEMVVCDPACGTGGFLIGVLKHLEEQAQGGHGGKPRAIELLGAEVDERMAWVAQMNLLMHGVTQPTVHLFPGAGSLSLDASVDKALRRGKVDLILTNPPFGSDFTDQTWLLKYELGNYRTSRRRGVLFVERCLQLLRPGGQLCIVLDEGILNGPGNEDVRGFILERAVLEAVISLPEVTFMPYASVKASILLMRRRNGHIRQVPVFMAEPEQVGHRPNGDPLYGDIVDEEGRPVLINDLPKVLRAWREYCRRHTHPPLDAPPMMFVTPSVRFAPKGGASNGRRLDTRYYHPAREVAEEALSRAPFPTPRLAELVVERHAIVIPAEEVPDDLCRYVGLANIEAHTGKFYVSSVRGHTIRSAVRIFKGGDILFSKLRPELRKVVLVPDSEEDGYVSSECFVFRALDRLEPGDELAPDLLLLSGALPKVDSAYLAYLLRSDIVFGQLVYQVTGVGRPRIDKSSILDVRVPLPPLNVQRGLVRVFEQAMRRFAHHQEQSRKALADAQDALRSGYELALKNLCP